MKKYFSLAVLKCFYDDVEILLYEKVRAVRNFMLICLRKNDLLPVETLAGDEAAQRILFSIMI